MKLARVERPEQAERSRLPAITWAILRRACAAAAAEKAGRAMGSGWTCALVDVDLDRRRGRARRRGTRRHDASAARATIQKVLEPHGGLRGLSC